MVVRRAAKHIETTSTSAMTFFTDGRRRRWPMPAATPRRPEWISCRYSCLCCYRCSCCCRCTFFTINSRNQTIQVANTENANVNWKICATIEHKEQQATDREGGAVGQGSCIHTCKHVCVCVCVRWELKRFDLCAKNYASTATWTSCKTMGKGAGCRQEAGRGGVRKKGIQLQVLHTTQSKQAMQTLKKLSNDIEMLYYVAVMPLDMYLYRYISVLPEQISINLTKVLY